VTSESRVNLDNVKIQSGSVKQRDRMSTRSSIGILEILRISSDTFHYNPVTGISAIYLPASPHILEKMSMPAVSTVEPTCISSEVTLHDL
jgi:hypothetical protein